VFGRLVEATPGAHEAHRRAATPGSDVANDAPEPVEPD
jgi:hypothetical protein